MTAAMVLCAGHGVRLRPLTEELPKPLLPLGDQPHLLHIYEQLRRFGAEPVAVNVHHLSDVFVKELAEIGAPIRSIVEPSLKGTAGGLAGARSLIGDDITVVWNGDIVAEPPLSELCATLQSTRALAGLVVSRRSVGEGTVGLGGDGRIVRMRGRRFGRETVGGDYIGVAALSPGCLSAMPDQGCLVGDFLLPQLMGGAHIQGVVHAGAWSDAGTPASYHSANLRWLGDRDSWVGPSVAIDPSVTLCRCIVGKAARVLGYGLLERVVVWPGAVARAPLANAVVTPRRVVRI